MSKPDFWDNKENAQNLGKQATRLKNKIMQLDEIGSALADAQVLWELLQDEEEKKAEKEMQGEISILAAQLHDLELETLFAEAYDGNNAILSLHAGAGGTEAQDWVSMLFRMYLRFCETMNYKTEVLDLLNGEEAGIKSVTFEVNGENAYGYLKAERGVHRLIRLSPFDASGKRHTSFASLDVLPEVSDEADIELDAQDLRIDTYRSGGAGGQHVNTTDSAVRITHIPTGLVAQCQNERSQLFNKDSAMRMLKAMLLRDKIKKQEQEVATLRGDQMEIGWGSQIRTYVFHPYSMAKDHRTNYESGNIQAVMNGEIKPFIEAYLRMKVK